jgi:HEAT repeat protein
MVSPAAGTAGRELLEDLLFDPDTLVRQPAASQLKQIGASKILETIESVRDWKWDESLSGALSTSADYARDHSAATLKQLKSHEQAEIRAGIAWGLGNLGPSKETSDALLAALDDPDFEVRRGAAHSLGKVGGDGVADRLDGIANTEDPRVRVMTAWSQVNLGDKRGYAHLSRLVFDDDARAATQACEALGRIAKRDAVELLLSASEDPRPVVRGAAVTALAQRARKSDAPHRAAVEELLASLVKDDDEYVRAAARAAVAQRARCGAKSGARVSSEDERLLGQIGYVADDDPDGE